MLFNKKGSLEISIQAIVIVVLAMTLLGLGLGFIKGMFANITKVSEGTFAKIEEQLQRDMVTGNDKLVFSQTKIPIERGKSVLLGWGTKNDGFGRLDYYAEFAGVSCPVKNEDGSISSIPCPEPEVVGKWFTYKKQTPANLLPYFVEAATQKVERVELGIPSGNIVTPGLYLIELAILDSEDAKYATTDLFVTVT